MANGFDPSDKSWFIEVWACYKIVNFLQNTNNTDPIAHIFWVQNLIDVPPPAISVYIMRLSWNSTYRDLFRL